MKHVEVPNAKDIHSLDANSRRFELEKLFGQRGTPPPEICLDWAWQINNLCAGQLEQPLTWANLHVDASGELHLQAEANSNEVSSPTAVDLIQLLMRCSEDPANSIMTDQRGTRSAAARVELDGLLSKLERQTLHTTEALQTRAELETVDPPQQRMIATAPRPQSPCAAKTTEQRPKALPLSLRRPHGKRIALGAVLVPGAIVLLMFAFWPANQRDASDRVAQRQIQQQLPAPPKQSTADALPETSTALENSQTLALSDYAGNADAEITNMPTAEIQLPSFDNLQSTSVDNGAEAVQPSAAASATTAGLSGAELSGNGKRDGLASVEADAADSVDVMQELHKVTLTAENRTEERDLPVQNDESRQPALLLETSPMLQVNKISTAMAGRMREPSWRVRLAAGEGFEVTPDGPQVIEGRNVVRWTIADPEAKDPATNIVIMVALLNNRSASLRWRIAASAEDVPFVSLPLGDEFLDAAQVNLGLASQQLQLGIDQLKLASKTKGLPTELRTAISSRRRQLENQLTISKRVLEVVADANQLVGWIDGQIEIHAELHDLAQPDSTPVLQFGSLEKVPLENDIQARRASE